MYKLDDIIVTEEELVNVLAEYFCKDWALLDEEKYRCTDSFIKDYIDYYFNHFDSSDYQMKMLCNFYKSKSIDYSISMYVHNVYFFKIPSTNKFLLIDLTKDSSKPADPNRSYLFDSILKLIPLNSGLFDKIYNTLDMYKEGNIFPVINKKESYIEDITFEQSVSKVYPVYGELTANILNFIKHRLQYFVIGEDRWKKLDKNVQDFLISGDFNYYLIKNLNEEYITPSIIATSWASAIESLLKNTIYKEIIYNYFSDNKSKFVIDIIETNRKMNGKFDKKNIEKNLTLGTLEYLLNSKIDSFIGFYDEHYSRYDGLKNDLNSVNKLISRITEIRNDVAHGLSKDIETVDECYKKLYFMDGKVKALIILLIDLFL